MELAVTGVLFKKNFWFVVPTVEHSGSDIITPVDCYGHKTLSWLQLAQPSHPSIRLGLIS